MENQNKSISPFRTKIEVIFTRIYYDLCWTRSLNHPIAVNHIFVNQTVESGRKICFRGGYGLRVWEYSSASWLIEQYIFLKKTCLSRGPTPKFILPHLQKMIHLTIKVICLESGPTKSGQVQQNVLIKKKWQSYNRAPKKTIMQKNEAAAEPG